jgi:ATP-dependent DNA helicase RecQ
VLRCRLELEGVLEATGTNYAEYRFQLSKPIGVILGGLEPARADLARRLIDQARAGTIWRTLDVDAASEELHAPRARIESVLADLALGDRIVLKAQGARQGFRRLPSRVDVDRLGRDLIRRFQEREQRDVARIQEVLAYAQNAGCLTCVLLSYFGEELPEDCGHCARCLGIKPGPLPPAPVKVLGTHERQIVAGLEAEGHAALTSPRQMARFLCGLGSPATKSAQLTQDPRFGTLADVPFAQVLGLVEAGAVGRRRQPPIRSGS